MLLTCRENFTRSQVSIPPLTHDNQTTYFDKNKVKSFTNYYFLVHSQNSTNKVGTAVRKYCTATQPSISNEIRSYIKKLKSKISAGKDLMHTIMIKNLPRKDIVCLTNIITAILLTITTEEIHHRTYSESRKRLVSRIKHTTH